MPAVFDRTVFLYNMRWSLKEKPTVQLIINEPLFFIFTFQGHRSGFRG
jgi:hypothetical protein